MAKPSSLKKEVPVTSGIEAAIKEKKAEKKSPTGNKKVGALIKKKSIKPTVKKSVPAKAVKKTGKFNTMVNRPSETSSLGIVKKSKPRSFLKSSRVSGVTITKKATGKTAKVTKKPTKAKNTPEFGIEAVVKGSGYSANEVRVALRAIDYPKGGYFYNFKNQVGVDRAVAKIKKHKS